MVSATEVFICLVLEHIPKNILATGHHPPKSFTIVPNKQH
jgi:hypothetical protein